MTLDLYYAIYSDLSEKDIIVIYIHVRENRNRVKNVLVKPNRKMRRLYKRLKQVGSKTKTKIQRFSSYVVFGYTLLSPLKHVTLPFFPPSVQIEKVRQSRYEEFLEKLEPQFVDIKYQKIDKIQLNKLTPEQLKQIETLASQVQLGSISMEEAVLKIRGGVNSDDLVLMISAFIYIYWLSTTFPGATTFTDRPTFQQNPFAWMYNEFLSRHPKPYYPYCPSPEQSMSRFDREVVAKATQMSIASSDENGFIMSRDDAIKLLTETFPGEMQITNKCRVSEWQAASHLYHGIGFGINPLDYGISQAELMKITQEEGGFLKYVMRGNKLPTRDHVRAYQKSLNEICLNPLVNITEDVQFFDATGKKMVTVFQLDKNIVVFNQQTNDPVTTNDLITAGKRSQRSITKFQNTGMLGAQKWIDKWSNNNK